MAGRADRNLEKERFWRQLLEGHAGSGLSIRQYCTDRGVSQPSFFAWRRELARRDSANKQHSESSPTRAKPKAKQPPPAIQRFVLGLFDYGCGVRGTDSARTVSLFRRIFN